MAQVQDPYHELRVQPPPYVLQEAHALEGLVYLFSWNGVEGVPDIEAILLG